MENRGAETLPYPDGDNSVKVSGVSEDKITLKFGDDYSYLFLAVVQTGGVADFSSRRIFEKTETGIQASV